LDPKKSRVKRLCNKNDGCVKMDVVNWAKHMYKVLNEREQDIARSLLAGSAKDWDQYKMMVGEARGLSFAKEEIKALLENNADDIEDLISS